MYDATVLVKHAANLYTATLGVAVKDAPSDATAFAFWLSATLMVSIHIYIYIYVYRKIDIDR